MPTLKENLLIWNKEYDWSQRGDEWSESWGDATNQWHGSLYPRLKGFVPADTILEIAPGFGRWTQFLAPLCKRLILVDLSGACIEYCKGRFSRYTHIEYHTNDGKSLDMVKDGSVDFVFSFDSLVHAEMDVIDSYLQQFARKLKPDGTGFIHHSNLGEYQALLQPRKGVARKVNTLMKLAHVAKPGLRQHRRGISVTTGKFRAACESTGLACLTQEVINWGNDPQYLIDCISVFARQRQGTVSPLVYTNPDFMREAEALRRIHAHYPKGNSTGKNGQAAS